MDNSIVNNNMPNLPDDMSQQEKESVCNYIENGLPGIIIASAELVFQWFQLYMSGKTYTEISETCNIKKDIVLYIAYKSKWLDKKLKYYNDILENMSTKITNAKLESANTVITVINVLSRHINEKLSKYPITKDDTIINSTDMKLLAQFLKYQEKLDKLMQVSENDVNDMKNKTLININLGDGGTVSKSDSGSIEITSKTASELLLALAANKKEESDQK